MKISDNDFSNHKVFFDAALSASKRKIITIVHEGKQ